MSKDIRTRPYEVEDADGDPLYVETPRIASPEGTRLVLRAQGLPGVPLTADGVRALMERMRDVLDETAPTVPAEDHRWTAQQVALGRWAAMPPKAAPDAPPPFPLVAMTLDGVRCYPLPTAVSAYAVADMANAHLDKTEA